MTWGAAGLSSAVPPFLESGRLLSCRCISLNTLRPGAGVEQAAGSSRAMSVKLSVVFVSYNSAVDLDRALASLRAGTRVPGLEVLVVDNASRDIEQVRAVTGRHRARLVTLRRNVGYGAAANRAAGFARGDYVAVANPDLVFRPGSVDLLVRFLDEHPDVGAVGPQFLYPDGTPQPSARRFPSLKYVLAGRRSPLARFSPRHRLAREFQYLGSETAGEPVAVEALVGAFTVFRRAAFESVHGFDERYFMFAEDMDICRRIGVGWKLFVLPQARVVHMVGRARRQVRAFTEFHRLRSLRRFMREGCGAWQKGIVDVLFTGYLGMLLAGALVGLGEFEYSWQSRVGGRG